MGNKVVGFVLIIAAFALVVDADAITTLDQKDIISGHQVVAMLKSGQDLESMNAMLKRTAVVSGEVFESFLDIHNLEGEVVCGPTCEFGPVNCGINPSCRCNNRVCVYNSLSG